MRAQRPPEAPTDAEDRGGAQVLVVSAETEIVEEIDRLAAAAGVRTRTVCDPIDVLSGFGAARLVLLGSDCLESLAGLSPPRRDDLHLVTLGPASLEAYREAMRLGVASVVSLPEDADWLVEALAAHEDARRDGAAIAVLGACGGVGASSFACALGERGALRGPSLVMDLDPWGSGLDRMLGLEERDGLRWEAFTASVGRLRGPAVRDGVPRRGRLGVLSWSEVPARDRWDLMVPEVLTAARRVHDLVVLDVPRGEGSAQLLARSDLLVVLAEPSVRGALTARGLFAALTPQVPTGLVVGPSRRRGPRLSADELGEFVGVPVVADVRAHRRCHDLLDAGVGGLRVTGSLARAAEEVLDLLGSPTLAAA